MCKIPCFFCTPKYSNDVLSGKIICGECGANYRRITRNTKSGKAVVWRCANRVEYGNRICRNSITVSNTEIESAIAEKLLLYRYDEIIARHYLESVCISNVISVKTKAFEKFNVENRGVSNKQNNKANN